MSIQIRGHHLLCMLTYAGKGYTPRFTANYDETVARLNAGEVIEIVTGPDTICQPMLAAPDCHCFNESVTWRDATALADAAIVLGRPLAPGTRLKLTRNDISALRIAFSSGAIRNACHKCEWFDLCSDLAADGYSSCRLAPPSPKGSAG
ncbi:hypothetical protein JM93_00327 [Roseibium hamelinense]|uniref:DUF1284 domain-containing protein n=1 Tax=Roseibium hamelinense TaxID=150831 RepID=A0A562TGP1_9HYPH|nr:DUF1284 domain-containing protein [Roseibium hamelinense]MTI46030.1 DUF1284 domain-containing protein [Roseibium hamelinense]TWI92779.1 hypothetical protein JM93_00327 [Roseibium hamelinense]